MNNLGPGAVVLDLGAHGGEFAHALTERFGVRCIAVEASAEMAGKIRPSPTVRVRHVAVAGADGEAALNLAQNYEASSLLAVGADRGVETVATRTLGTLLDEEGLERVDLAKVDVEGAEIAMFEAATDDELRRVAQFSVEFHDSNGLVSVDDVRRVTNRLREVGFAAMPFTRGNHNWLFFQADRCGVSRVEGAVVRYAVRPVMRLRRRLR